MRLMDIPSLEETTLSNGLRAVAIGRPGTSTVASKVFLKAGSRYDGDQHGIGHCLEHALFRGTTTRSGQGVYGAVEDLGGRIQGETVKDCLAPSAVTAAWHYRTGLEVLDTSRGEICHLQVEPVGEAGGFSLSTAY